MGPLSLLLPSGYGRAVQGDLIKSTVGLLGFPPCLLTVPSLSEALRAESPRRNQDSGGLRLCHSVTSSDTGPPKVTLPFPGPRCGALTPAPPASFLSLR